MARGSDRREISQKEELNRTLLEFEEKLRTDPYQPGITHPGLCGDDIQDMIEDVLYIRDFSEMTIRVTKEEGNSTISVEVIERKK